MSSSSIVSLVALFALVLLVVQPAFGSRAHNGFFQGLNEQQKEQVSTILHGGLSKAEIKEQLRHWVSSQSKETQEAFQNAEKAQEGQRLKIQARHQQRLMTVSLPAKDLDTKIRAIYADQTLTKQQTCEKVQEIIKSADEQVKKELKLKEQSCE